MMHPSEVDPAVNPETPAQETLESLRAQLKQVTAERDLLQAERSTLSAKATHADSALRRTLAENQSVYLTGLDITNRLELTSLLPSILRRAVVFANASNGVIHLLDKDRGELVVAAEYLHQPSTLNRRLKLGESVSGQVLLTGQPQIIHDYQVYQHRVDYLAQTLSARSVIAVPLQWQSMIIGVLTLYTYDTVGQFSEADVESLQRITVQAAIAIHQEQVSQQELAYTERLKLIAQASSQIAASPDYNTLLGDVARILIEASGTTQCTILELQPDGALVPCVRLDRSSTAYPVDKLTLPDRERIQRDLQPMRQVLRTNQWIVFQRNDPLLLPEVERYMDTWSMQSLLLLPMILGQRLFGFVILSSVGSQKRFSNPEIDLVITLAMQAGIALRQAQLQQQLQAQKLNEQSTLANLSRRLLRLLDPQLVAEQVVEVMKTTFDSRYVAYLAFADDQWRIVASSGWEPGLTLKNQLPPSVTGVQFAVQTREAIIIEDTKNESRFVVPRFMLDKNLRSGIIVPIAYGTNDQAWAALVVAREGPLSFTKDEAGMLKLVGSMTGTAMERSQLFMSVQQYAEQLEARVHERQLVLQAERDRFQTLLAATEEALLVFDSEGLIVQVNRVFERQHGLTTTKLVGRTSLEVLGRDLMRLVQHSEPRSVWRGEFSVRRHDGSSYTVTASLAMVHNPLGDTIGFIASLRDPSYHDETNRIKEKFIANVSHELRTPLINVQLYVHLLENGVKNQHDQYLAIVKREVNRVQAMIDELLLSARLDRNGFPMQIQPVNLNLLLKTLVDDRVRHINNQGVSIELDLTTSPCRVLADEPMLIQAFANLLTNATTYTQEDGLIIIKTTIDASHQPSQVLISVKDTGLGIPASELPHLFERFFRGNAARVTGTTGTGLGLSIVKTVLERHGGTITVKSEVGKGSEFVVKLPLYMGGEGAVASQSLATPQH